MSRSSMCVERTRTRGEGECQRCDQPIQEGQRYRELVLWDDPVTGRGMHRETAHVGCVDGQWRWATFGQEDLEDGLQAVRSRHGHRFRRGAPVRVLGGEGEIVRGAPDGVVVDVLGAERIFIPSELVFR